MQYLSKLIQKDLGFGYTLNDAVASHDRADVWNLNHGTSKENGQSALVFSYEPAKARAGLGPPKSELAKKGLLRLKTLRHPDVLKYLSSVEGSDGTIFVATEPATPLATLLTSGVKLDRDAIVWGLFTVSRALGFMHQSGLIHARVNATTVFVTPSGDWRIGGLEAVTQHSSASALSQFVPIQAEAYRSPEYAHGNWQEVMSGAAHSIDSWALGCLMYEAHAGSLTSPDQLRNTQFLPKPLLSAYQKLLSASPSTRAPAGELPNHPYFKNSKFVELNMFVENLALKGQLEREAFLGKLPSMMDRLPDSFCTFKILPMLSQSIETGAGASSAFMCVVKMKDRLSETSFANNVASKYATGWYSNSHLDRSLRVEMFAKIDLFLPHFDPKDINNNVFPAMCSSFQDMQAPAVRDAAVKAVLNVAPYLSEKNLNSVLMSHFARLQVDPEPAIRTNTTVCLGKLAVKLTDHARSKVLIPAFLRALKDPFPPARAAGVNAILFTVEFYNAKEIGTRVLPAVSPLLVDGAEDVRNIAFNVVNGFIKKLNENHENMKKVAASAPPSANGGADSRGQNSGGGGGWGLSSFTSMTVALLSKGETSDNKPTSSSTGISSESFRSKNLGVKTSAVPQSVQKINSSSVHNSFSSSSGTLGSTAPSATAPPTFSSTPLTASSMPLKSQSTPGGTSNLFGDDAIEEFDDDDGEGWGDMDVKTESTPDNEEDMFVSMMAPTNRPRGVSSSIGGTKAYGSSGAAKDNVWDTAPKTRVPSTTRTHARPSTLETTLSRSVANSRKKKVSGGDDWEAFLGGTSSKRKTSRS